MRRGLVVGVVGIQTAVLLLAGASPALSHATFPGQGPLAAQADQTLNMAVPEERDPDTHNVGVTVALPAGWTAVRCQATAPWHCTLPPGQIQWTKDPGAPPGPDDVAFVFTVHTGGPGNYQIPVNQTYTSGEVVHWIGPPDSDDPAPVLTVNAPAASPAPTAPASTAATSPAPAPSHSPTPAPPAAAPAPASPHPTASTPHPAATAPSAPPSAVPASSPSPSAAPTATETANSSPSPTATATSAPDGNNGKKVSHSGSGAALVVTVVAVVALLGAGWAVLRRRHAHG